MRNHHESEEHSGGTPTCTESAACTVCGGSYIDGGNHADNGVTEWLYMNESLHYRLCLGCGINESLARHNYGTATCTSPAACPDCKATTGGVDKSNHVGGTEIRNAKDATEFEPGYTGDAYCKGCGDKLADGQSTPATHVHRYSSATCTKPAACSCGATTGSALGHNPGAAATCTTDQVCTREGCGAVLAEKLGHAPGAAASCTADQVCTREGYGAVLTEALGHAPGAAATCTTDQVCTREGCGAVLAEKLGHAPGAAATCTTDQVCTREGCGAVLAEKLGHDYAAVITKPTCTKKGYTTYTCSRCKDSYKADQTAARGHWYDLWYPNIDGTHSAECKRYGCNHVGTTECTLFEITVKDGEADILLTVCPVCGDHEETPFAAILEAVIKAVDRYALPRGEQIVRGIDAPFDGVLYAFTAAYEFAGKVEPFKGTVSVTLPLDAEQYTDFKLVRVDVTPAIAETGRTEVWTDVAFTYEYGKLTIETDTAGLFLLIPKQ